MKFEQPGEMSFQLPGSFISLFPSALGDSGLNQFLGDHANHISQLQGKELIHNAQFFYLILANVFQLPDQSPALPVCTLSRGLTAFTV